ncbi:MAG TPA: tryptophan 7-halogenase [Thermoanaerobaculia bacterium]|nr:tryptophan 7-halogenase [Thermoanaerobaculia bacterium]
MSLSHATSADPLPSPTDYDVVVLGGALAGAATALLLRRELPAARVLVVERQERFGRKVGEATVETSAYFLEQLLGQAELLAREHLPKHGLRYWFSDRPEQPLGEMTEIGPARTPPVPSYQLDRSRLDESMLDAARAAGCEVARPAKVVAHEPGWPVSRLRLGAGQGTGQGAGPQHDEREVTTRWVIDASGRQTFVARRLGLLQSVDDVRTTALWSRWRGVADVDDAATTAGLRPVEALRRNATNHYCGYGWWCWVIPLAGGDTSIGLVYDRDLFELPAAGGRGAGEAEAGSLAERYRAFLAAVPGLRELLAGAEPVPGDFLSYRHLPYRSTRYADRGWALVGDAGSFIDPYYSPGLDHLAMSVTATVNLVAADLAGRLDGAALEAAVGAHNDRFSRSYERWLQALYRDKYELMGDAELTACAYLLDTALYYFGIVTPVYRLPESIANPSFGLRNRGSEAAFHLLDFLRRRLVRVARFRRGAGGYGRRNAGWRLYGPTPSLGLGALPMLLAGLRLWLRLEVGVLLRRPLHRNVDLSRPAPIRPRSAAAEAAEAAEPATALADPA